MPRKRSPARVSGFLNLDKPPGWTSHDVVARVRRIVGERRVGHAGTLDPAATGVLPVAVGHATRMLPYMEDSDKAYLATIRLGVETDSCDRDGRLIATSPVDHVGEAEVSEVLSRFTGPQEQIPPMHSAIRVGGRRLHEIARQGGDANIPTRDVHVYACELVSWSPPDVGVRVVCSKGTYVRSLARDIGIELGCGAMLANLVRVRAGWFHLAASLSIHNLELALKRHGWEWIALHPDAALAGRVPVVLDEDEAARWFSGQEIHRSMAQVGLANVYNANGIWVGVGTVDSDGGCLRPKRVIHESSQ